jgi:hypothetical protein
MERRIMLEAPVCEILRTTAKTGFIRAKRLAFSSGFLVLGFLLMVACSTQQQTPVVFSGEDGRILRGTNTLTRAPSLEDWQAEFTVSDGEVTCNGSFKPYSKDGARVRVADSSPSVSCSDGCEGKILFSDGAFNPTWAHFSPGMAAYGLLRGVCGSVQFDDGYEAVAMFGPETSNC